MKSTKTTREVAELWFSSLQGGQFDTALALLADDVRWENIRPVPGLTDLAPWLGTYCSKAAVIESFSVWGAKSKMLGFTPSPVFTDGDEAVSYVHEHAQCLANGKVYDLHVATRLRIVKGQIVSWQVYWDPTPLVAAYKGMTGSEDPA